LRNRLEYSMQVGWLRHGPLPLTPQAGAKKPRTRSPPGKQSRWGTYAREALAVLDSQRRFKKGPIEKDSSAATMKKNNYQRRSERAQRDHRGRASGRGLDYASAPGYLVKRFEGAERSDFSRTTPMILHELYFAGPSGRKEEPAGGGGSGARCNSPAISAGAWNSGGACRFCSRWAKGQGREFRVGAAGPLRRPA